MDGSIGFSMTQSIGHRFEKSTHISMISNCVMCYTSAELYQLSNRRQLRADFAGNSARSPTAPRRASTTQHRAPTTLHRAQISSHRMMSVFVFHNVLRMFHDVLLVVHDVLQCFTCLMMFYYV